MYDEDNNHDTHSWLYGSLFIWLTPSLCFLYDLEFFLYYLPLLSHWDILMVTHHQNVSMGESHQNQFKQFRVFLWNVYRKYLYLTFLCIVLVLVGTNFQALFTYPQVQMD